MNANQNNKAKVSIGMHNMQNVKIMIYQKEAL